MAEQFTQRQRLFSCSDVNCERLDVSRKLRVPQRTQEQVDRLRRGQVRRRVKERGGERAPDAIDEADGVQSTGVCTCVVVRRCGVLDDLDDQLGREHRHGRSA